MKKYIVFILLMGLSMTAFAASKKFTLVIDAGHGGGDAGAVGNAGEVMGAMERLFDMVLAFLIGAAFGKMITEAWRG